MADTKKEEIVFGIVGGIIVVGVIVYMSSQGGSGSGFAVLGPDSATTTAVVNAQAAADASNNALASAQSNNATQAFLDYINSSDTLSATLASTQAGLQQAQINANSSVSMNATNAASQVAIAGANDAAQTAIANFQTQSATAIGQSASSAAVGVAQAAGNAQVGAATAQANGAAQAAKNAQPGNSTGGIISSILGPVASLFGFL